MPPCDGCKNPAPCADRCQVFTSEQILRERVLRAVKAMPRCQLTTTIRQAELERFTGLLLVDAREEALRVAGAAGVLPDPDVAGVKEDGKC